MTEKLNDKYDDFFNFKLITINENIEIGKTYFDFKNIILTFFFGTFLCIDHSELIYDILDLSQDLLIRVKISNEIEKSLLRVNFQ